MFDIQEFETRITDETITPEDLTMMVYAIQDERKRRENKAATDQAVAVVIEGLQDAGKLARPEAGDSIESAVPWKDPQGDPSMMYPAGVYVTNGGRTYLSKVRLNHWEPGAPGVYQDVWEDVTPPEVDDGEVKPVPYEEGRQWQAGERTIFEGASYTCMQSHFAAPGWNPRTAHGVWRKDD